MKIKRIIVSVGCLAIATVLTRPPSVLSQDAIASTDQILSALESLRTVPYPQNRSILDSLSGASVPPADLPRLITNLEDKNQVVRDHAFLIAQNSVARGASLTPLLPTLKGMLEANDPGTLLHILSILRLRPAEATECVSVLLKLPLVQSDDTYDSVTVALGDIGDPRAVPALKERLNDRRHGVRGSAAGALLKISKTDERLRHDVIQAAIAGPVPARVAIIEELTNFPLSADDLKLILRAGSRDGDGEIRKSTARTLQLLPELQMGDDLATELVSDQDATTRVQAAIAVARSGEDADRIVPVLITGLESENEFLRISAAEALGWYGPKSGDAVLPLLKVLESAHLQLKTGIATALGYIGAKAKPAVPLLRNLERQFASEPDKARSVAESIARIENPIAARYFPDLAFAIPGSELGERRRIHLIEAESHAKSLQKLGEAPLLTATPPATTTIRLTHCGAWRECVVTTVARSATGDVIRTSNRCPFNVPQCRSTERLTAEKYAAIDNALSGLSFQFAPGNDGNRGFDGETYLLERSDPKGYHAITRWSPDDNPLRNLFRLIETGNSPGVRPQPRFFMRGS